MPIDDKTYNSPATKGDVSAAYLFSTIALLTIADCLEAIKSGREIPDDAITKIRETALKLDERFDRLTGWTKAEQ